MNESLNLDIKSPFLTFELENKFYLYDGGSGVLSHISSIVFDILNSASVYDLKNSHDYKCLISKLSKKYTNEEINNAFNTVKDANEKGFLKNREKIYSEYERIYNIPEEKSFKGCLWLNVAHDCNLRCTYCFGQGGNYGLKRSLMTIDTAKKCVDYWFDNIDKNQPLFDIVFFGGEPLMNQEVLFFTVDYVNSLLSKIGAKARYNITTNGTILNENIIKILQDNKVNLMLSIDGLEQIHNRNRPYASGRSSYTDVLRNIETIKQYTSKLSCNLVCTKNDIPFLVESVEKLWSIGINYVYASLCIDRNQKYQYEDYLNFHEQVKILSNISYNNIVEGKHYIYKNLFDSMMEINKNELKSTCSLWDNGTLAFSPEGNVYKCHRFVGNEEYKIGNINHFNENLLKYRGKKNKIEKCSNCWAQINCGDGCPYENQVYNDDINVPSEEWCTKTKINLEESLKLYARVINNNPEKLKEFISGR